MKVLVLATTLAFVVLSACSDDAAPADAIRDAEATPDAKGCCPPDPSPGCCMQYGGWKVEGATCGRACDGMPEPNQPGWSLTTDEHGCRRWTNPYDRYNGGAYSADIDYCGAPRRDAGAPADAASD